MRSLNKDQLTLLNGSGDFEMISLEDMYCITGGLTSVNVAPSCPYGQHVRVTNATSPCTAYGVCTTTWTYFCV